MSDSVIGVEVNLAVRVDDCVRICTMGEECGPGDSIYLANWGKRATQQNFVDDASQMSYMLSYGDAAAGDHSTVEVLLQQGTHEAAGEVLNPFMFNCFASGFCISPADVLTKWSLANVTESPVPCMLPAAVLLS